MTAHPELVLCPKPWACVGTQQNATLCLVMHYERVQQATASRAPRPLRTPKPARAREGSMCLSVNTFTSAVPGTAPD